MRSVVSTPARATASVVVLLVVLATIASVLFTDSYARDPAGASPRAGGPPPAAPTPAALRPYTDGVESSPLHLVEYGDYRCPACVEMAVDQEVTRVLARWVDSGRLRFTWRDAVFFGPTSALAAQAAHAAALQGEFFRMHFLIFGASYRDRLPVTPAGYVALARRAKVPDLARFRRDIDSAATRRFVRRSTELAARRKVVAIPTLASNGTMLKPGSFTARGLERHLRRLYRRAAPGAPAAPADPGGSAPQTVALARR